MTLRDLLDSGLEGSVKIQCWESDLEPTVYWEGDCECRYQLQEAVGDKMDRYIKYIFPYTIALPSDHTSVYIGAICIELEQED